MGWAIASILIGVAILSAVPRIVGWMGAADDEPVVRWSRSFLPSWMTPKRERFFRSAWVALTGLAFVAMGAAALI